MTLERLRTTCNRDCPDSCGIVVRVEDGRIVEHRGDPEHGVTRGFLCYRGNHYLERFYAEDRILHPLRRTKAGWGRISWDDALDLAGEELARSRDRHGPLSVLAVTYSGIKGLVARYFGKRFWAEFGGVTGTRGGLSVEAADAAQELDFGGSGTHAPEDLANSAGFVVWGKNVATTRVHSVPFIEEARKRRGAKLFVIDPVRSATARKADRHFALRPGSDGWLAAGIARRLFERGAIDTAYVERHCRGFEAYRERILSLAPEAVSRATDLSPEAIEELAEVYATTKPLATLSGLGPAYWQGGGATIRLIDALAAITGNVGVSGGGSHTDLFGGAGLALDAFRELPEVPCRTLLLPRLGEELLAASDPPLTAGFIAGANPAATCPDTGRVAEALASLEFLVVVDQFLTASARTADLFLPCTTYLEMEDLVCAYGHHWLGLDQAVVPPLGEARSDVEIYRGLAERLGFGDALAGSTAEWIDRFLEPLRAQGVTREGLKERPYRNPALPAVPFEGGVFGTPSGKIELIGDFELREEPLEGDRLHLMATKSLKMVNAQINGGDLPAEPVVRLHPETAAGRGLKDGDPLLVESGAGSVRARLVTDANVRRDVLLFNPAAWSGDLQGVNQLRESILADLGDAAAMHETRVRVVPAD